MKILWICGSRIVGGAERVNIRLATLLRDRGHTIEVLCRGGVDFGAAAAAGGFRCHHGPLGRSTDFRAIFKIRRMWAEGVDAALVTTTDEWVWACLAKSKGGPRLILARYMALPLARGVLWLAARRADAIVAVSDAVRDTLLKPGLIEPERVRMIPHPLPIEPRLHPPDMGERRAARSDLGLSQDGQWIGFFGGFSEGKGIADLIEAVRIASRSVGAIDVLMTGRDGGGDVESWARALGDAGRLHFVGNLPYERVATAMTAVDAVAVATRNAVREASSLVLHEALALGTPGVAYATGGIPELFGGDGVAGLLARPDDPESLAECIARVLKEKDLAMSIGMAGIRRIRERCDADRVVAAYESLFAGLMP